MLQAAVPRSPPVWNPTADAPDVREFLLAWQDFNDGCKIEAEKALEFINAEDMMAIEKDVFLATFETHRAAASLLYNAIHPSKCCAVCSVFYFVFCRLNWSKNMHRVFVFINSDKLFAQD